MDLRTGGAYKYRHPVKTCAWCSGVYTDDDEWSAWRKKGDPVTHVELGKWADVLLVAPLSANTLSKFANGSCDNLLTCLFRAWDVSNRDKIVCMAPAMNTQMCTNMQLRMCVAPRRVQTP